MSITSISSTFTSSYTLSYTEIKEEAIAQVETEETPETKEIVASESVLAVEEESDDENKGVIDNLLSLWSRAKFF